MTQMTFSDFLVEEIPHLIRSAWVEVSHNGATPKKETTKVFSLHMLTLRKTILCQETCVGLSSYIHGSAVKHDTHLLQGGDAYKMYR